MSTFLFLYCTYPVLATTYYVDPNDSIQDAIDNAVSGDEIEAAPGTYNEVIDFNNKSVRLYSIAGPEVTIIDANGLAGVYHVVQCVSGEDPNTILEGFTITGGNANGDYPDDRGGGMYNDGSSPTVTGCIFTGNSAFYYGGGMCNFSGSPTVTGCAFNNNITTSMFGGGGGMYNSSSSPTVTGCAFTGNSGIYFGGGMYNYVSSPTVTGCAFTDNSADHGGGMSNAGSNPIVTGCTFTKNSADYFGGGMYNEGSSPTVANCILWGNTPDEIADNTGTPIVTYSDVQGGYTGTGNIDADPLFVDAASGNVRLQTASPCIDLADNNALPTDTADLDNDANSIEPIPYDLDGRDRIVDGNCNGMLIVDIGAYEFTSANYGDFDGDCDVDFVDYSIFAGFYMTDEFSVDIAPTLAGDGVVDLNEFAILCSNWLFGK